MTTWHLKEELFDFKLKTMILSSFWSENACILHKADMHKFDSYDSQYFSFRAAEKSVSPKLKLGKNRVKISVILESDFTLDCLHST